MSSAIWKAIPRLSPKGAERAARAQRARGLEELPGLQRAALEVGRDRRVRVVALPALQRLAAREAETGVGEHGDGTAVALGGELREGGGEEIVAGRARRLVAVRGPHRRVSPADGRAVDQVVVDQRRQVHELDCDSRSHAVPAVHRRAQEREQRPQPLSAGRERLPAELADTSRPPADGRREPLLDAAMYDSSPGAGGRPRAWSLFLLLGSPVCRATIPPPSRR